MYPPLTLFSRVTQCPLEQAVQKLKHMTGYKISAVVSHFPTLFDSNNSEKITSLFYEELCLRIPEIT